MEQAVSGLLGLVSTTLSWGIANALPLAVGALLGSELFGAGLGLVGDMLGRAKDLCNGVTSKLGKK